MANANFDDKKISAFINDQIDKSVIPALSTYIEIENASPAFDPSWKTNGLLLKAANHLANWAKETGRNIKGMELELIEVPDKTPLIFITIPASSEENKQTILLYGHMDKQPPLTEAWSTGLHPYKPVIKDGKLYGRGGADDGYSIFSSLTAILSLQSHGIPHARCVVMIEAGEESGSPDLPYYIDLLAPRIQSPNLIVCLDSGCGNYEQMWSTVSLRGIVVGNLKVELLKEGVHSGSASGIVPDTFRIARKLLSRIENENTGEVLIPEFWCDIPEERKQQFKSTAQVLAHTVVSEFPWVEGSVPIQGKAIKDLTSEEIAELIAKRTWEPTLTVTGADGLPTLSQAGNVLRTQTSLKLSMRTPPRVDAPTAGLALKALLEKDPPYGAKVTLELEKDGSGWDAPALAKWLETSLQKASNTFYGKPTNFISEGGSIPFMGMLGKKFPQAQFVITGVLGPASNAHGPNEFLHIDYMKKITACVASIIADHFQQTK
jgi:acetylornithine deacetylase/succinyl-diaminopimelate desuccinylase-like protein